MLATPLLICPRLQILAAMDSLRLSNIPPCSRWTACAFHSFATGGLIIPKLCEGQLSLRTVCDGQPASVYDISPAVSTMSRWSPCAFHSFAMDSPCFPQFRDGEPVLSHRCALSSMQCPQFCGRQMSFRTICDGQFGIPTICDGQLSFRIVLHRLLHMFGVAEAAGTNSREGVIDFSIAAKQLASREA